jgi:nitroimidazol reductase NimA-like FMN-containing flavoprotein (pyridoxamine 5'-phosphate oxidase superfamily)
MTHAAPSSRTRVKRLADRGRYDAETIHAILDAALLCHIGYVIEGRPYVTPTTFWRDGTRVYWHGSSASRMLEHQAAGAEVCFSATHVDGFVMARSGFHHSINYRSVMAFGRALPVLDADEKRAALDGFVERLFPGRAQELRPATSQELKATLVLSMALDEASAKIRTGPPKDDEEDYASPVWAGVLPVLPPACGPAIPDARLDPGTALPPYLESFAFARQS